MDANRGKVEDLFGCLRDFVKVRAAMEWEQFGVRGVCKLW